MWTRLKPQPHLTAPPDFPGGSHPSGPLLETHWPPRPMPPVSTHTLSPEPRLTRGGQGGGQRGGESGRRGSWRGRVQEGWGLFHRTQPPPGTGGGKSLRSDGPDPAFLSRLISRSAAGSSQSRGCECTSCPAPSGHWQTAAVTPLGDQWGGLLQACSPTKLMALGPVVELMCLSDCPSAPGWQTPRMLRVHLLGVMSPRHC